MEITLSGGDIYLNDLPLECENYQPPQYQRAISYEDTAIVVGDQIVVARHVTDHGPMAGVWQPFIVHCWNATQYDPTPVPWRGMYIYQRLLELFQQVNTPLTLYDPTARIRYRVMFAQEGLTVTYAPGPRRQFDPETNEELGPEFNVQIALIEVPQVPGIVTPGGTG